MNNNKLILALMLSFFQLSFASTGEEGTTSNPNCDSNCLSGMNMSVSNNSTTGTQTTTTKGFSYYTGNSCSGYNLMNNFSNGTQTLREALSSSCGWPPPPPPPAPVSPPISPIAIGDPITVITPPVIIGDPPVELPPPITIGDPPSPVVSGGQKGSDPPPSYGGCGGGGVSYPIYATDWDGNIIDPPTVVGSWSDGGCPGGL
jgi:hypothetical protein